MGKISGSRVVHFLVNDANVVNGDRESACGQYLPDTADGSHTASEVKCHMCLGTEAHRLALYTEKKTT